MNEVFLGPCLVVAHMCCKHIQHLSVIHRRVREVEWYDDHLHPSLEVKTVQPDQRVFHLTLVLALGKRDLVESLDFLQLLLERPVLVRVIAVVVDQTQYHLHNTLDLGVNLFDILLELVARHYTHAIWIKVLLEVVPIFVFEAHELHLNQEVLQVLRFHLRAG